MTTNPLKRPMWYVLDEQGNPLPAKDEREAMELLSRVDKRSVGYVEKTVAGHHIWLSTVFLVMDCGHPSLDGPDPVLFESMLFIDGRSVASGVRRYTTKKLALKGHNEIAELLDDLIEEMGKQTIVSGILGRILEKLSSGEDA